jgi:hypothetical protein
LPEDAQEEARQRARSSLGTKPAAANVISNTKEEKHLHRHRSIADRVGGRLASLPETIPRLTVNISQSCIQPSTVKKPASAEHIVINCQPQELNKKLVLGQILQDGKCALPLRIGKARLRQMTMHRAIPISTNAPSHQYPQEC